MTPQERLDYLLESVLIRTEKPITVAEIVEAVGIDAGRLVVGTLQAAAQQDPILAASFTALSTVGILLSSDDRQQLIDDLAVAGNWPDEVRDEVKALGAFWQPRWVGEGYETEPTLQSVTAEIAAEALQQTKKTLSDAASNRMQAFSEALAVWDGTGEAPDL